MWLTSDTTAALVEARNDNLTLSSVKKKASEAPAAGADEVTPSKAPAAGVAGTLEGLAAVIPTGITAMYLGGVLVVQGIARSDGDDERAGAEAAMAKAGKSAAEIKSALADMPVESTSFIALRWALFAVALAVAAFMTWRAAKEGNDKSTNKRAWLIAEPFTAIAAFVGWALATPGTPLGAYLDANELLAYTAGIGVIAGLLLFGAGSTVLKNETPKPSKAK